ncbi:hypothetical protein TIFTF001_029880 [Ficus carica]|uniref:Uncharacterized protein n=1 Tax=Ficus carica TaxID=3494 RepID=A0AA88DWK4_FICCA|nr:hypothetical protein TIFTF001_029880 [Ficus carica]
MHTPKPLLSSQNRTPIPTLGYHLKFGGIGFSHFSNGKSHNPKFPSKEEIRMSTSVHLVVLDPPDRSGTDQEVQEMLSPCRDRRFPTVVGIPPENLLLERSIDERHLH